MLDGVGKGHFIRAKLKKTANIYNLAGLLCIARRVVEIQLVKVDCESS